MDGWMDGWKWLCKTGNTFTLCAWTVTDKVQISTTNQWFSSSNVSGKWRCGVAHSERSIELILSKQVATAKCRVLVSASVNIVKYTRIDLRLNKTSSVRKPKLTTLCYEERPS